jgi:hypothetical protein
MQVGLLKESDDQVNGERFTVTVKPNEGDAAGHTMDSFPNLTEQEARDMLREPLGTSDALVEGLFQAARADYGVRHKPT